MRIEGILWLRDIVDKIISKHNVEPAEVEELFENEPRIRFVEQGEREGEDVYLALGQADSGRFLAVLFIYKETQEALIISARTMAPKNGDNMAKNKRSQMPKFKSIRALSEYFETHDMGDYWDKMPIADFEIDIRKKNSRGHSRR